MEVNTPEVDIQGIMEEPRDSLRATLGQEGNPAQGSGEEILSPSLKNL